MKSFVLRCKSFRACLTKSLASYKESQPTKNAWSYIDKHKNKTLVKLVKELRSTIGNSRKAVNDQTNAKISAVISFVND